MTFNEFVDDQADRIGTLAPRSRAAIFWLIGSALSSRINPPEGWAIWFDEARSLGREFITTGVVGERAKTVWVGAQTATGDQSSQLLNSAIICLSTPVGIALDPSVSVGAWVEHALFPIMQRVSMELFDDVAFPGDDEELDAVFAHPGVQAAADYCRRTTADLAALAELDDETLDRLAQGSEIVAPDSLNPE